MKRKIEKMINNIATYEQLKAVMTTFEMMYGVNIISGDMYTKSYDLLRQFVLTHDMSDDYTQAYHEVMQELYQ